MFGLISALFDGTVRLVTFLRNGKKQPGHIQWVVG